MNQHTAASTLAAAWLSDNSIAHIDKVTLCRARLVLEWVTMSGFNYFTFIAINFSSEGMAACIKNQPSTPCLQNMDSP